MSKAKKDIKSIFYELYYNNKVFGQNTTNQSLQKQLNQFRNNMAVDFYNILLDLQSGKDGALTTANWKKCKDKIVVYADKYLQWDSFKQEPVKIFGDRVDSRVYFVLQCAKGSIYLLNFKTIVDKALLNEMPTDEDLEIINNGLWTPIVKRQIRGFSNITAEKAVKDISAIQGIPTGKYTLEQEQPESVNSGIIRAYWEWVVLVYKGAVDVERCGANGCDRLFIPYKSGNRQVYCSTRCRVRQNNRKKNESVLKNT